LGTVLAGLMSPATEILDPASGNSSLVTEFQESLVAPQRLEAVSLSTVFENEAVEPRGDSVFGTKSVPPAAQARIQVVEKEHTARVVTLSSATATIGRDQDNAIVLDDNKASRRHAQITWDGLEYYVMDLDSTNGTYLENTKLLPGVAEVWKPNQILRIGEAWMRLIPPKIENRKVTETLPSGSRLSFHSNSSAGLIGLSMVSPQLTVEPGGRVSASLTLLNQSADVDHFSLSLKGIPKDWIASLPAVVQLMPGEQKETEFTLHIPRASESRAGAHPLILRVNSQRAPSQFAEMKLTLTIGTYSQFQAKFQPQRVRAGRPGQLTIYNQGNSPVSFRVQFKDAADEVAFQPADLNVTVPEGSSASAEYSARAQQFRLLGGEKRHPFHAQVSMSKGEPQTVQAEVISYGLIPLWVPPLILLLCVALLGIIGTLGAKIPQARHTSETATALVSDLDQDGLAFQQETTLGCNPSNPDTDGDGLSDSEEKTWGADCNVRDSDHDNLTDGEEVHTVKTNPMNPDTDGDGIPDNVDSAPGALPTLTPSPAPTLAATPTLMPTLEPTTAASPTPRPERIVFVSNRDGKNQIYVMNVDGSNPTRLTRDNEDNFGPVWSPDGNKIAFYQIVSTQRQIYIMNADGSDVSQLNTGNMFDYTPAWSPDGKKIAFTSSISGNPDIYVINRRKGDTLRLTDNEHSDISPSWSPDGNKIVFQSYRDLKDELYVMDADGSNLIRLTSGSGSAWDPKWSPDGSKIVFSLSLDGNQDICVVNVESGIVVRLTNDSSNDISPAWSPDGSKIVFASNRDGNTEIYIMNADGGNVIRLTNNNVDDWQPNWSR
jgi:Tol biopolymer transport system component